MKKLLLAALATVVVPSAQAESSRFETGRQLKAVCIAEPGSFNIGACSGFVLGIVDIMPDNCLADKPGVNKGQLREVVIRYISDHPEKLHEMGATIVVRAIRGSVLQLGRIPRDILGL